MSNNIYQLYGSLNEVLGCVQANKQIHKHGVFAYLQFWLIRGQFPHDKPSA